MTREEIEDVADLIGHGVVEPPEDASDAEVEEAFRLASIATDAAAKELEASGDESLAHMAAKAAVRRARRRS